MADEGVKRRELIAGGLGAAATAAFGVEPERAGAAGRAQLPVSRTRVYDVAVIGAGLAGLTAAHTIRSAGRSVIVLEARDRVGGRTLDHPLGRRNVVELGGEWAGPGQDRVLALARRLGVATFASYSRGHSVYYDSSRRLSTYKGDIPPAGAAALAELAGLTLKLNSMAATVPAATPWTAPQAADWDRQTIATWMTEHLQTAEGQSLGALSIRSVYGEEPSEISLLDLLQAIRGVGGDFNTLIGSAQSIRFVGGPQQLSRKLAAALGTRVRLGIPIDAVEQHSKVTLHSAGESFLARRAILTLPKTLVSRIRFSPALPPAYDQILQRQPMGSVVKANAIYPTPFWRDAGLSGTATSEIGPIRITYDNSPPNGKPGVLVGFMEGNDSRHFYRVSPAARRQAALECFARYFGAYALKPVGYVDVAWAEEPFTRGAYGSFNPPGVLTSLHQPTSEPAGRLHFAGSDSSALWPGYMDGAIRSGEAAAADVIASL